MMTAVKENHQGEKQREKEEWQPDTCCSSRHIKRDPGGVEHKKEASKLEEICQN